MISRTKTGRSFGGLARYLVQGHKDQQEDKQSEILAAEGVRTDTVEHMIADFNRGRKVNPGLGQAVWHTSLSFNPDDASTLDSEKMREIAEDYMQEMGLVGTQFAIIRHRDKPGHEHLHIVANRVADDGHTISDKQNFYRSKAALVKLIQKYELTPPQGMRVEKQHAPSDKAELAKYELRQALHQALATATDRPALLATLRAEKINAQEFTNKAGTVTGISFEKDGHTFKGSAVAREYSLAGLDKQLAANQMRQQDEAEQARQATAQEAAAQAQREVARAQEREQLRQALAVVLATATSGGILREELKAHRIDWQIDKNEAGQSVSLSFGLNRGSFFEGTELNPAYSLAGVEALIKANRLAAQLAERQAAERQAAQLAAERQEAQRQAAQAAKGPELPAVERKWEADYQRYTAKIAQQNVSIQARNAQVAAYRDYLNAHPDAAGLDTVLEKLEATTGLGDLKLALERQEKDLLSHERSVAMTFGQTETLQQQAKGLFRLGLGAKAKEATEKLEILANKGRYIPDNAHREFAIYTALAAKPAPILGFEPRAYQQPEVVPLSLTAYAAQREAERQVVGQEQVSAQAQRPAPGQREAQQLPTPQLKPELPAEEAPTRRRGQKRGP